MPTILIADDQTDVLAALRLLFKGERYEIKTAAAPAEVLDVVNKQELDVVLIDLNYARDTTSGTEGLDLLARIQAVDPLVAGSRDDCVGQRRARRRSHASRCARLYSESPGTTPGFWQ